MLADPRTRLESHPVEVQLSGNVTLTRTDSWIEQHGEECDHDRVQWRTTVADAPHRYTMRGSQRGITMTSDSHLTEFDGGTLIEDRLVFAPSIAGRFGQQILPWLLLAVGLLPKLLADEEEMTEFAERLGQELGCEVTVLSSYLD